MIKVEAQRTDSLRWKNYIDKGVSITIVALSALLFIPGNWSLVGAISLRSIIVLTTLALLASASKVDKKFVLESLKIGAVLVSIGGSLGLGGTSAPYLVIGAIATVALARIGLLALEEDEDNGWQLAADILVGLFALGSLIFRVEPLMTTSSTINMVAVVYATYVLFNKKPQVLKE